MPEIMLPAETHVINPWILGLCVHTKIATVVDGFLSAIIRSLEIHCKPTIFKCFLRIIFLRYENWKKDLRKYRFQNLEDDEKKNCLRQPLFLCQCTGLLFRGGVYMIGLNCQGVMVRWYTFNILFSFKHNYNKYSYDICTLIFN